MRTPEGGPPIAGEGTERRLPRPSGSLRIGEPFSPLGRQGIDRRSRAEPHQPSCRREEAGVPDPAVLWTDQNGETGRCGFEDGVNSSSPESPPHIAEAGCRIQRGEDSHLGDDGEGGRDVAGLHCGEFKSSSDGPDCCHGIIGGVMGYESESCIGVTLPDLLKGPEEMPFVVPPRTPRHEQHRVSRARHRVAESCKYAVDSRVSGDADSIPLRTETYDPIVITNIDHPDAVERLVASRGEDAARPAEAPAPGVDGPRDQGGLAADPMDSGGQLRPEIELTEDDEGGTDGGEGTFDIPLSVVRDVAAEVGAKEFPDPFGRGGKMRRDGLEVGAEGAERVEDRDGLEPFTHGSRMDPHERSRGVAMGISPFMKRRGRREASAMSGAGCPPSEKPPGEGNGQSRQGAVAREWARCVISHLLRG